jgi:hypothetical protein
MVTTAWEAVWRILEAVVGLLVAVGGFVMRDVITRVRELERNNHGERLAALEANYGAVLRGQERQEEALREVDRKVSELLRALVPKRDHD